MSYLALYRRYRPKTFDDLIGQEHISKTLINQIEKGNIGHAYLFCGTRGTGKTTTAKIFSKAINCLSPINGSPCGKCEVCKALEDSSNLDIIEIDAASNNGVNEIRELKDKITYPPISCRYKVYIIDEVHMLTTAAFNALLKTLEEPPKHAVFILATTEAYKLPQTILSRCMRFDFKLIPTEDIEKLLKKIFDEIGKKYENEAISLIAKAGEGSIRDALSIADICVSYSDYLTYSDVEEILGSSDKSKILEIIEYILKSNAGESIKAVENLLGMGKSIGLLNRDIIENLRDVLVAKICEKPNQILCLPNDKLKKIISISELASNERILRCIEIFATVENDLKYSTRPKVIFETALIKAIKPETDYNIEALMARIKALEDKIASGNFINNTKFENNIKIEAEKSTEINREIPEKESKPIPVTSEYGEPPLEENDETNIPQYDFSSKKTTLTSNGLEGYTAKEILGKISKGLRQNNELMLWAVVQSLRTEIEGDTFIIIAKNENDEKLLSNENNITAIKNQLKDLGDIKIKVKTLNSNKKTEDFDNGVDQMKKIFGEDIVIIK